MKISIIGSGFVGQAVGKGFLTLGNELMFYDITEKELPNFTKDMDYAIKNSDVCFICVPTPQDEEGRIDLRIIQEVSEDIGKALWKIPRKKYFVIVIKSTVVPGTTEEVIIPSIEKFSGMTINSDFGVCMCPEFLTEIAHSWTSDEGMKRDFLTEDRIVIGESNKRSGRVLADLYKPLNLPIFRRLFRTDLRTAELIKYVANCALATKISFWNDIFLICKELGIDSKMVADIVSIDPRIGKYGTVHGKAFGGKCLPKDLKALICFVEDHKVLPRLLKAVDEVNEEMKSEWGVRE